MKSCQPNMEVGNLGEGLPKFLGTKQLSTNISILNLKKLKIW